MEYEPFNLPKCTMRLDGEEQEMIIMLDDAEKLRSRREDLGMTQQQVADAAGIKITQYQNFESGRRPMSGASMRIGLSICRVLKLDPYLFGGK